MTKAIADSDERQLAETLSVRLQREGACVVRERSLVRVLRRAHDES
jgi:hypothetical protein